VKFHVSIFSRKARVYRRRDLLALIDTDGEATALDTVGNNISPLGAMAQLVR